MFKNKYAFMLLEPVISDMNTNHQIKKIQIKKNGRPNRIYN